MGKKYGPVWVVAEQIDNQVQSVSLQLIGQARKLAEKLNSQVEVILLGEDIEELAQQLIQFGADRVYLGDSPELAWYQSEIYAQIIEKLAIEKKPEIVLLGSTYMGKELAPLVAARLQTGLTAHCIDLVLDENNILEQKIPAYGGLISIMCPEKRPQMATVAKGVFSLPQRDAARTGDLVSLAIPDAVPRRVETIDVVRTKPEGVSLESAPIVVAGGAGLGDKQGWGIVEELASELNAAIATTRPAMDNGWAGLETMVGQSGKMVSPELYIGIGLSGELQHMVGIVGAKVMVAINIDPKSPVFEQVDYGIVEDCQVFVPIFIDKIRKYRQNVAG